MGVAGAEALKIRLEQVRSRIEAAANRSHRDPKDITLVAVSKTHPADIVFQARTLGLTDFGENRVQEAETKIATLNQPNIRWHLIGHLQTNKVRRAVRIFDMIHSLDSAELAQRLEKNCSELGREQLAVLIQVDFAGESTKSGIAVDALPELLKVMKDCSHLSLQGLMVLPPFFEEPETVRPFFRRLRELRDELQTAGQFGAARGELSMGMTHDFEVAIEEGATMLRVGTAIFGERERTAAP
jgi:pyridoxal phosphate enzyme (YggS family)